MATVPSIPAISHLAYNSERELLTAYVRAGYQYTVIIQFLSTFHDLPMSLRTLKNRLHDYGIQRRVNATPLATIRDCMKHQLQTSAANVGYRQMHRILKCQYDMRVSCKSTCGFFPQAKQYKMGAPLGRRHSRSCPQWWQSILSSCRRLVVSVLEEDMRPAIKSPRK